MNLPTYDVKLKSEISNTFEFFSEGKNGKIRKVVVFQKIADGIFNLAFGDKIEETGTLDDENVSDNGDTEKVLATVVLTIFMFTDKYPDAYIFATGSTPARTRLYRRSIFKFIEEAKENFNLYGVLDDQQTEVFIPNKDYKGFVIQRKKL
jgi:hypothetical protein